jgi:hypothetical protein
VCHARDLATVQLVPSDRPTLPLLTDCCSPVVGQVIKPDEAATLAAGFKALSDPARLKADLVGRGPCGPGGVRVRPDRTGRSEPADSLAPPEAVSGGRHLDPRAAGEVGLLQARSRHLECAGRFDCLSVSLNPPTTRRFARSGVPERGHRSALRRGVGSRRGWVGRPPRPCRPGRPAPSPRSVSPGRRGRRHRSPW